ncbi:MAG: transcription antitermination factor NusB [bacterium]|nr:transcription antitermination factor NusB [bacterium]
MNTAGARRHAREFALRILYARDLLEAAGVEPHTDSPNWWSLDDNLSITHEAEQFAYQLASGVVHERERVDEFIRRAAIRWRIERMGPVDRNILRIGAYELLYQNETPPSVVMNEAIELAKCYGDAESDRFINGILDAIAREAAGESSGESVNPDEA